MTNTNEDRDTNTSAEMVDDSAAAVSRRRFLAGAGVASAGMVSGLSAFGSVAGAATRRRVTVQSRTGSSQPPAPTTASVAPASVAANTTPSPSSATPILVLLTLYGGNDGLNTVIPLSDSAYLAGRQALGYQPNEALPLDASFGLNPSMTGFKGLWDAKRLAIVHGVGYPNPNRSHFRSMDIWQSGIPERAEVSGWLGRWHDATGADPLRMVNIGASLPRALVSVKNGGGAALPNGQLQLPGSAGFTNAFTEIGRGPSGELGNWGERIRTNGRDLQRVLGSFAPILRSTEASALTSLEGGGVATGEQGSVLDTQLDEVTRLIKGGAPTRVYSVSLGGFDTHANEKAQHARLVGAVDRAVTRFVNAMSSDARGKNVTVLIYSEFGRRVAANLSDGTDHGTAGPVFVVGPAVKGGFYGEPASLTNLDDGDLRFTTDFRSVYSTVLGTVLGIESASVLGKAFPAIPFL